MIYLTHARTACTEDRELLDDLKYPQWVHWFPETYARAKGGLVYPPHLVMQKVLDPAVAEAIQTKPGKTAFIFASGNANLAGTPRPVTHNQLGYTYKFLPLTLTNIYAGRTAQQFGPVDLVQTDASACASSLKVLMDVQLLMDHCGFERVIVLAGEDQVANSTLDFFGETKASLAAGVSTLPSAFDEVNGGFHVGQGAALAVLERPWAVTAPPLARLIAARTASEHSTNPLGQLENGEGFAKAIRATLHSNDVLPEMVSVVKTHGTGTEINNRAERNALGSTLPEFIATSYKPRIGHTMGASGLLETILLLRSLRAGHVPGILNRTQKDSVYLSDAATAPSCGYLLSLAAGMGNIYAAALFDWRV